MPEEIEVPTEHLHEKMEEAAEEGEEGEHESKNERTWISRVAVSSALLAVAAAISALLAGHHANEAMFEEISASDRWAMYQAKGIKESQLATKVVLLKALEKQLPAEKSGGPVCKSEKPEKAEKPGEKSEEAKCPEHKENDPITPDEKLCEYGCEKAAIKEIASEEEASAHDHMKHHVWFARAVTIFQIAIAMGAIAVLARRPKLWLVSVGLGGLGSVFLVIGLL
jgi:hypothetical protein